MRIIGCDLHARQRTLAMLDTTMGEVVEVTLKHEGDNVREFYSSLPRPVRVGIEATGSMQWFLNLMEELGLECLVGHPAQIRAAAPRKQKNDRRDAELIPLAPHTAYRRSELQGMYEKFEAEIEKLNQRVEEQACKRPGARLLMSHPGVGPITALATEVFLGDPARFADSKALASYVGMIPREYSSGGRQRLGGLSKQGNPLLRFLWGEAGAQAARKDPELQRFYRRKLVQKGLGKASVAVARKLCILVALVYFFLPFATFFKKKEKPVLPEILLKAQTVVVTIEPDAGEPMNDPTANRNAREEVEKTIMNWGRFRLVQETSTADIVVAVKKGTEKAAPPTIGGGPVDSRPVTVQSTDNQIRLGAKHGQPPNGSDDPDASASNGRAQQSVEVGPSEDSFLVYLGGDTFKSNNASIWSYRAKNALRPPSVTAVQEFRKAITDAEQAAAKKQQQQSPQPRTP